MGLSLKMEEAMAMGPRVWVLMLNPQISQCPCGKPKWGHQAVGSPFLPSSLSVEPHEG